MHIIQKCKSPIRGLFQAKDSDFVAWRQKVEALPKTAKSDSRGSIDACSSNGVPFISSASALP
eukprot:9223122-Karenia_brevis.AAC.1